MALVRVNTGLLRSQFFWLACLFCLTAGHLPSFPEVIGTLIFVALVWQIPRIGKWATVGFVFLAYYGLEIVTLLVVRAIPKETWSKLSPSPIGIPAQIAYVGSVSEISVWAVIVLLALLRFYEVHDQQQGSCVRFVAAGSIIWGSLSFVGERLSAPAQGIYAGIEPMVPLAVFIALPASFIFWNLKGRTWGALFLRAFAALLLLGAVYFALVFGIAMFGLMLRSRLVAFTYFNYGGAIASKLLHPYQAFVVLMWAGLLPFLRSAAENVTHVPVSGHRRFPLIAPVFLCAAVGATVSFALDAHKQQAQAQEQLVQSAKDELQQQKLAANVRWRIILPRDEPKVLAMLAPPLVGPDGTAYVVARKENRLHAIDPSGQVKWSFSGVISAEPAVGPDTVTVVGTDKTLYTLDASTGQIRWSTKFAEGSATICAGPARASDGTIYAITQENASNVVLNAISAEGKLSWELTKPSEHMCSIGDQVEMWPQLLPAPVVGADGMIYFTHEGTLHAIDSSGSERWSAQTDRPVARVLLGHGAIYTYGENIIAFSFNGEPQWSRRRRSAASVSPSIGEDGTIYLPDNDNMGSLLLALNPDGSEKWTFRGIPGIANVLAGPDGIIYLSTPGLCALDTDHKRLDWNYGSGTPAIAPDGTIYAVEYDGHLYRLNPPVVVSAQNQ
jgi:outer membrane protein assembly factor BamB